MRTNRHKLSRDPLLCEYVNHRDEQLTALGCANGVSRDQAKNAFQILAYGGSVSTWLNAVGLTQNNWRPLDALAEELRMVRNALLASALGQRYRQKWPRGQSPKSLRLLSYTVQDHERQIAAVMIRLGRCSAALLLRV